MTALMCDLSQNRQVIRGHRMAKLSVTYVMLVCLGLVEVTQAYSSGAPEGACGTLMPGHGVPAQTSQPPFKVTTTKTNVAPGEQIEVTISGSSNFKGFFLRVKQGGNFIPGEFQATPLGQPKCDKQGLTHISPEPKTTVKAVWTVPANVAPTPLQFVATVVQEKSVFWTQIPSAEISIGAAGQTTPIMPGMLTTPRLGGMTTTPFMATTPRKNTGVNTQVGLTLLVSALFSLLLVDGCL